MFLIPSMPKTCQQKDILIKLNQNWKRRYHKAILNHRRKTKQTKNKKKKKTNKKKVVEYLMDNFNESSSENNVIVQGIIDYKDTIHQINKKSYHITQKDKDNKWQSRLGFNMHKLLAQREYTLCIESTNPNSSVNVRSVHVVSSYIYVESQTMKKFDRTIIRVSLGGHNFRLSSHHLSNLESIGGAVVRTLASHQCGPGSIPRLSVICGLSLLVLYSTLLWEVFPGYCSFPLSAKTCIWFELISI